MLSETNPPLGASKYATDEKRTFFRRVKLKRSNCNITRRFGITIYLTYEENSLHSWSIIICLSNLIYTKSLHFPSTHTLITYLRLPITLNMYRWSLSYDKPKHYRYRCTNVSTTMIILLYIYIQPIGYRR